mmetsp:Transcript_56855/g.134182  ORF Transcript_56855/g.134182 Transcript_56855/m.134182 type:complete len:208 (+) Transcript_56855:58-681(+)
MNTSGALHRAPPPRHSARELETFREGSRSFETTPRQARACLPCLALTHLALADGFRRFRDVPERSGTFKNVRERSRMFSRLGVEGLLAVLPLHHLDLLDVGVGVRHDHHTVRRDDDALRRIELEDLAEHVEGHGAVRVVHEDVELVHAEEGRIGRLFEREHHAEGDEGALAAREPVHRHLIAPAVGFLVASGFHLQLHLFGSKVDAC